MLNLRITILQSNKSRKINSAYQTNLLKIDTKNKVISYLNKPPKTLFNIVEARTTQNTNTKIIKTHNKATKVSIKTTISKNKNRCIKALPSNIQLYLHLSTKSKRTQNIIHHLSSKQISKMNKSVFNAALLNRKINKINTLISILAIQI